MMKTSQHILGFTLALASVGLLTGCLFEEDDIFSESAALRLEHFNDNLEQRLTQPANGWVMEYFANDTSSGYNIMCRFLPGFAVVMASDHQYLRYGHAGTFTQDTSAYQLLEEDGPVLAFNMWNDILSVFADPVSPSAALRGLYDLKDGVGLGGDYSFNVVSVSGSEIWLRGERTSSDVRMFPAPMDWEDYLAKAKANRTLIFNNVVPTFYLLHGGDTLYLRTASTTVDPNALLFGERLADPLFPVPAAYVPTIDGFRLNQPYRAFRDSISVREFRMAPDSSRLLAVGSDAELQPMWLDNCFRGRTQAWTVDTTTLSASQRQALGAVRNRVKAFNSALSVRSLMLGQALINGRSQDALQVRVSGTVRGRTTTMTIAMAMPVTLVPPSSVRYEVDSLNYDENVTTIGARSEFIALGRSLSGDYDAQPDSYFRPTTMALAADTLRLLMK